MPHTRNRLLRVLKHRWLDEGDARRLLGPDALERLAAAVRASEAQHSGEIRICIEAGLPLGDLWQRRTPRQRALAVFSELCVWNTEANNGVLIYLLLAEHAIEIVADRGIAAHVPAAHWQQVVAGMRDAFRQGQFEAGLLQAVQAVHAQLVLHFALAPGQANPNELPDAPVLR